MGPHDGEWIRDEAQPPGGRTAGSETPGEAWPPGAWPPGAGRGRGHGGAPGFSVRAAAAVAMLAAAAGVAAGFFLVRGTPAASVADRATPSASAPSASAPSALEVILTGRVLAVSATSITIGGAGPSVTAAVTGATKITGTARGIGGVKVGDEISARLTGTASHLAATAIQDPASQ